jgi:hypothetical protein
MGRLGRGDPVVEEAKLIGIQPVPLMFFRLEGVTQE